MMKRNGESKLEQKLLTLASWDTGIKMDVVVVVVVVVVWRWMSTKYINTSLKNKLYL